jgi:primary-amine oxidase
LKQAANIVKNAYPTNKLVFRVLTLSEPPKALLAPYLSAENASKSLPSPPARVALVQWYLDDISKFWEGTVDLDSQNIRSKERLVGKHSYTDGAEMQESEIACLADERVQDEIKAMDLPEDAVVCVEPWTYGTDGANDMAVRRIMVCSSVVSLIFPRRPESFDLGKEQVRR